MGRPSINQLETDITKNPGYQLREIFKGIFPLDYDKKGFINKIDHTINANDKFIEITYLSSLNFLIRRLINSAIFLSNKYSASDFPAEKFNNELRQHLKIYYNFPTSSIQTIFSKLLECLYDADRSLSEAKKKIVRDNAERRDYGCYICGKSLIFNKRGYPEDHPDLVEIEHLWPKSLGGSNELYNLEVCCHSCNNHKKNHIDQYDFHFEDISITSDKSDSSFSSEFNNYYRVATALKDEPECASCGKKALHKNRLVFERDDTEDSWHYLNINTYCDIHASK